MTRLRKEYKLWLVAISEAWVFMNNIPNPHLVVLDPSVWAQTEAIAIDKVYQSEKKLKNNYLDKRRMVAFELVSELN